MNNKPGGARSSEKWSHPIDVIIIIITTAFIHSFVRHPYQSSYHLKLCNQSS
jgi:hypothetical protein